MNNKTIDKLNTLFFRIKYYRVLIIGVALISLSLATAISGYRITNKKEADLFLIITCLILGLLITFIGLYYRVETEMHINKTNNKKNESL